MPIGLYIQLQSAACTASRRRNFWQKGTFRSPYCVPKVPRGVASYPRMRRSVRWNYWRGGTTGSQHRHSLQCTPPLGCVSINKSCLCKDVFGSSQPMRRLHFGQRPFQRRLSCILKRGPGRNVSLPGLVSPGR